MGRIQSRAIRAMLATISRTKVNRTTAPLGAVLSGGRVTKVNGIVASYSPELGLVETAHSADRSSGPNGLTWLRGVLHWSAAPVAMLASGGTALAQDACVLIGPDQYLCEDLGTPNTTGETITGADAVVQIEDGFEVQSAGTYGLIVESTGSISIAQISGTSSISGLNGISARNNGGGVLSITSADVSGIGGAGLIGVNYGTDLIIDSSAGNVSSTGQAIRARNNGVGVLSITAGNVSSANETAIFARNFGTDLVIDSSVGNVRGKRNGIYARNYGSGVLSITTGDVTGTNYSGILARSSANGTDIIIDSSAGGVSGGNYGIAARNFGSGMLSITTGDASGGGFDGIAARNFGTDLLIDSSAGSVNGGRNGIYAINYGSGTLSITAADVTGANSVGIFAYNSYYGTDLVIDSSAGSVSGGYWGIDAINYGIGALSIVTGDVTGTNYSGILGVNSGTDLIIDSSAGSVSGGYSGIFALNNGSGVLSITTGGVGSDSGNAIEAWNYGTDLVIGSSAGSVSGGDNGIYAVNYGSGKLSITTGDVSGTNSVGIDAFNSANGSDLVIDSSAGSVSGGDNGISAVNYGSGMLSITTGNVSGGNYGILADNGGGGSISIDNGGTLAGGTFAVFIGAGTTGPVGLVNDGTIIGAVSLGNGDDSFANTGSFIAAGASSFDLGNDGLTNVGRISVASMANFSGLELFSNGGLITLMNNTVGGALTTSGNFVGTGGSLAIDVDFVAGTADRLVIGGAATGGTTIIVNDLTNGPALGQSVVVVDAAAGTAAGAFALAANQPGVSPFVTYALEFDSANNDFLLSQAVTPRVFEASKIGEAAQSLWYRSADAWSDHRANARFAEEGPPLWLELYGQHSQRDDSFADSTGVATGDAVLDYSQEYFGFQAGYDIGGGEPLSFGLTAGYLSSQMKLKANGNHADFDVFNLGASASFRQGGFYVDALVKYDFISGDLNDPSQGGFDGEADGDAYGAHLKLGYRSGDEGLQFEPYGSLEFQQTDLDDLAIADQAFLFDSIDGLRGIAGLRIGGQSSRSDSTVIGYYLDASAVHEFEGEGTTSFVTGNEIVSFDNNAIDTYAHLEAGLSLGSKGPMSGFFQVEGDVSGDYTSYGAKIGMRIGF